MVQTRTSFACCFPKYIHLASRRPQCRRLIPWLPGARFVPMRVGHGIHSNARQKPEQCHFSRASRPPCTAFPCATSVVRRTFTDACIAAFQGRGSSRTEGHKARALQAQLPASQGSCQFRRAPSRPTTCTAEKGAFDAVLCLNTQRRASEVFSVCTSDRLAASPTCSDAPGISNLHLSYRHRVALNE